MIHDGEVRSALESRVTNLEHKTIWLEHRTENHAEDLKELRATVKYLRNSLTGIDRTLQQIKWLSVGATIVLFGKELGISRVLSIILGVF